MRIQLTDDERNKLSGIATKRGVSMQSVIRTAICEFIERNDRLESIDRAAQRTMSVHADALDRLGR